jgi:uncharacterized protein YndB with AHSA1/START domain
MTETALATQVYQVLIKASAQQIWDAITKPEFTRRYFHGVRVETSGQPGTPLRQYAGDSDRLVIDVTIIDADPPHRLVHPWRPLYDEAAAIEPESRVTWLIAEQGDGVCLLTVTHDRLEQSPRTAKGASGTGWRTVVDGLKTLLETGESLFPAA